MIEVSKNDSATIISLRPNRSATWSETKWMIIFMVAVVFIIAGGWAFVGAWVILPFAGLEVGLFAYFMYRVCRQGFAQQIITITKDLVVIEEGIIRREVARTYDRNSLSFEVTETERDWHLPDIVVCVENYRLNIGEFLNKDDRMLLKDTLKNIGLPLSRTKWWCD
ncbi:DUF2244 domain-containing protein [Opacimonas viscosa]|uniref:DUF2244 domain-containing protein n=1 Tax=Opacimonas viscosa TaxID=2961944 RepID=A0AA41X188_9ALTE|nr:DUF2244 domain-containing protein [Opacimonas viscosa]MCP3428012.1 DUF2244 domain-containing protein [Opacimonas viscosa]